MATGPSDTATEGTAAREGAGDGRNEPVTCSACGTVVPEGARACPTCHRRVYRTCDCGEELLANVRTCPNCGARVSRSERVSRKRRTHGEDKRALLKYALYGAGMAAAAAILLLAIISAFAQLGARVEGGADLPAAFGQRLHLAVVGLGRLFGQIGSFFMRYGAAMLTLLALLLIGAGAGAVYYLRKSAAERRLRHSRRASHRVRRRKRE